MPHVALEHELGVRQMPTTTGCLGCAAEVGLCGTKTRAHTTDAQHKARAAITLLVITLAAQLPLLTLITFRQHMLDVVGGSPPSLVHLINNKYLQL